MKKLLLLNLGLLLALSACGQEQKPVDPVDPVDPTPTPVVEKFSATHEIKGTTSAGVAKSDTFIFEGETTDGIITKLNFDIIRNKGTENEISKKDLRGYSMNVSDATIKENEDKTLSLTLTCNGFDEIYPGGQFMLVATTDNLTADTTFKDLKVTSLGGGVVTSDVAVTCYNYLAKEAGINDFSNDTKVVDLLAIFDMYKDDQIYTGVNRVGFAGYNGGRTYGEQIDALVKYILDNKMTLDQVLTLMQTENQMDKPIKERDTIAGCTISLVGDFYRIVYMAKNGELFEGVVNHTVEGDLTKIEVVTQGYGGEVETYVYFDQAGQIKEVKVRDHNETAGFGKDLIESDFLTKFTTNETVDVVSGTTVTSNAIIKAVNEAKEYYKNLK